MILLPIPGTPLEPEPIPDKVAPCLRHWMDIAHAMHSPTWTAWEQETMEALYEYSRRNGTSNGAERQAIKFQLDRNAQELYNESVQAE